MPFKVVGHFKMTVNVCDWPSMDKISCLTSDSNSSITVINNHYVSREISELKLSIEIKHQIESKNLLLKTNVKVKRLKGHVT